mmetsp:Transcript_28117/g.67540  ORF Transcript_28117/g.67540 Transcript_28117/m.67540 type:complete len:85 (-) Transcript_28117:272-526(-)
MWCCAPSRRVRFKRLERRKIFSNTTRSAFALGSRIGRTCLMRGPGARYSAEDAREELILDGGQALSRTRAGTLVSSMVILPAQC